MAKKARRKNLKPPGKCIFCGGGNLSKEHIYPEWLQKFLPKVSKKTRHTTTLGYLDLPRSQRESTRISEKPGDPLTQKLRIVCETCNNGWMSQLQEKAKPALLRLIKGEWWDFSREEAKTLAAWVTMFTMVIEFADPRTVASTRYQRRSFMKTREPPPGWIIWVAPYNGVVPKAFWHKGFVLRGRRPVSEQGAPVSPDGVRCDTQVTTFNVAKVLFHAFSSVGSTFLTPTITYDEELGLRRIWPRRRKLLWWRKDNRVISPLNDDGSYLVANGFQIKLESFVAGTRNK